MKQNRKILTLQLERTATIILHIYAQIIASLTLIFFMDNYESPWMIAIIALTTQRAHPVNCPEESLAQSQFQWQRLTG